MGWLLRLLGRPEYDRKTAQWEYFNELQGLPAHADALATELPWGRDCLVTDGFEGNIGVGMKYMTKNCVGYNLFGGFKGRPNEVRL
jgi:hypothetical protein